MDSELFVDPGVSILPYIAALSSTRAIVIYNKLGNGQLRVFDVPS
jgi:hypothetical protein